MPVIDNDTLLIALQSVSESVDRYEALLTSDTLHDPENVTELLMVYDQALNVLKSVYQQQIDAGVNLPLLSEIISQC